MNWTLVILGLVLLVNLWLVIQLTKRNGGEEKGEGMNLLLTQLNELSRTVDHKMSESTRLMNESVRVQFGESAKLIREVTQGLTKLDETNKQVVSFADQLQSLQDILKNPKQRGVLGEYYLETLLKNVLPPGSYQMQYSFPDGNIVDAVVFVRDKIIPIDSKFSLENYNRLVEEKDPIEKERLEKLFVADLKNRISETAKYIQPGQGTMDFAFMFIPHEAIYYDLIINKIGALKEDSETLIQRAASKYHVLVVSPTSFLAYLQTVLQGLKGLQIEESVKGIIKNVGDLQRHLGSYEEYYRKMGNALGTAVNQYELAGKEFKKIDKDVVRITGSGIDFEPLTLDKPSVE
ncbi:MAG: DNA recombination protein RmuC [Candidatus Zambryskibacteria bacterium]|nr:DNA recombination protein RmuC [Candidatus Zambryskibacteria bacterium]